MSEQRGGAASDEARGGAHGVLCTVVHVVLLLTVDPVAARALPVGGRGVTEFSHLQLDTVQNIDTCFIFF